MGMFSETIADMNIKAVEKIRDKYLNDPTISEETKNVIRQMAAEVITAVGD